MKLDSGSNLKHLKVDGGMTNGDLAMQILADVGGFIVVRPEMREYANEILGTVSRKLTMTTDQPHSVLHCVLELQSNYLDGI